MRKLTLSLAVMAAILPLRGYPLGLGELELNSALNQELNADIAVISATPEDAEQIIVKLADRDAFSRAGMDRPFLLQQLKFKIIQKNGKSFVKVTTKAPIREPFLSFLLEIDWPQGHLLREYTLLLDPPVYNTGATGSPGASSGSDHPFIDPADTQAQSQSGFSGQQAGQQNAQASGGYQAASTQNRQNAVISSNSGQSVSYQYQAMPQGSGSSTPGQYRVQQNDTLWSIADRMRPDNSVSIEQMMLALARKNPEAFIQDNINGVKRGYILRTPTRDEINQTGRQQAVAQAREQGALWREYSQGAYSSSPGSALEADAPVGGTAAEQQRDADGHLSIVSANEDKGSDYAGANQDPNAELARLKQDLAMAREQLESEKLEKEDLRSRLSGLEDRVKRVIEMDDGELAELQQELQQTQEEAAPAEEPAEELILDEPAEELVVEEPVEELLLEEEPVEVLDQELDIEEPVNDQPAEDPLFVDEEAEAAEEDILAEEAPAEAQVSLEPVKTVEPPAFAQKTPKGLLDSLMEDPKLIGMVGGGLAFLLLLVVLVLKKLRGGGKSEEDEWAAAYENDLDSSAGGVDADLNATVENNALIDMESTAEMMAASLDDTTRVKPPAENPQDNQELQDALLNLDTGDADSPKDDVLAEADVYIAYGIYQQAEELLKNAIDANPDRDDYRLKLLETHYAAKNAAEFEQLAQDVKTRKGNDQEFWGRVAVMGTELSPGNSLYEVSDSALDDSADFDLPADDMQTTDFDLGLDDDNTDFNASLTLSEPVDTSDLQADDAFSLDTLETDLGDDLGADLDLGEDLGADLNDDLGLDLENDLANLTTEFEAVSTDTPPVEENSADDLALDLGELDDSMGDVAREDSSAALGVADDLEIDDDFSLDFDASDLGFEESEEDLTETSSDDMSLDADLDLGVDLGDSMGSDDSVEMDLGDIDMGMDDAGSTDIDLSEPDLGEMDLGDIDLGDIDLGEPAGSGEAELDLADDVAIDLSDDGDFDISELSEDVDEVSTKLDLAKAYIDMGDKDGARSILDEVKEEGNNEQQQQAEALLQQAS